MTIRTVICFCWVLAAALLLAQSFNAGSNGSDGNLTFPNAKAGDVIDFNPRNTALFPGGLDNDNDNVYHFNTITIPAGVTVRLRARHIGGPVTWLAQGNVTIAGTLDLSGDDGANSGYVAATAAVPGPGGFYGGPGGDDATRPPLPGFGPAGGAAFKLPASGPCENHWAKPGGFTGNQFLVPLIGGSGGGGYFVPAPGIGPGGGAGGGAILIATSATISIQQNGSILARGGSAFSTLNGAGNGAGGAIRLAANRIEGNGLLSVRSPGSGCPPNSGIPGRVRMEAFQQAFVGGIEGTSASGSPFDTFVSAVLPTIRVLSVAGAAVINPPDGTFEAPDVTITAGDLVPVVIQTTNIPTGTVVTLQVFSESGASQSVNFPALPANGTTSVNVKWPTGFSRGFLRASFTQ